MFLVLNSKFHIFTSVTQEALLKLLNAKTKAHISKSFDIEKRLHEAKQDPWTKASRPGQKKCVRIYNI